MNMDIENLLYEYNPDITPERGSLLIAEPMMKEAFFSRSVVLLLDVDKNQGHLGLVLNKETEITLHDLVPEFEAGANIPVFAGGPVDMQRLFMLHTLGDRFKGSVEIIPGLYVGGDLDDVANYMAVFGDPEDRIRFFLGYSGWSRNQLETEKNNHSWAVNRHPESDGLLTGSEDEYWRREVKKLGDKYKLADGSTESIV